MSRFWGVAITLAAVLAVAVASVYHRELFDRIAPPTPSFSIDQKSVDSFASIEGTVLNLNVAIPSADPDVSAVLYLQGARVEELNLRDGSVSFGPILVPPGRSRIAVEMKRAIGPFIHRVRHPIDLSARARLPVLPEIIVPESIWTDELAVIGTAEPRSQVAILINGREVSSVRPDDFGRFKTTIHLTRPGAYRVKVAVRERRGPDSVLMSKTAIVKFRAGLPAVESRKIVVSVGKDEFHWELEAILQADDPRAKALVEGNTSIEAFAHSIHGFVLFNRGQWTSELSILRLETRGGRIWVALRSRDIGVFPVEDGRLLIQLRGGATVEKGKDTIEIRAHGPRIAGFSPAAQSAKDDVVTWSNNLDAESGVVVLVSVPPPEISLWSVRPRDMLPKYFVGILYNLLAAIPILWVLDTISLGFGADTYPPDRARLSSNAYLLGTCIFFNTARYLIGQIIYNSGIYSLGIPIFIINAACFLGSLLIAFGALNLTHNRSRRIGFFLNVIIMLSFALAISCFFRALEVLNPILFVFQNILDVEFVLSLATALVCFVIGILVVRRLWQTGVVISAHSLQFRPILVTGAAALFFVVCWPRRTGGDALLNDPEPTLFRFASDVQSFISLLGYSAPVIMALLVAAALTNDARKPSSEVIRSLRMMLFASVLVGTSPVWGIVPVSLLLAMALLAPVVLISQHRSDLLSAIRGDVLANRNLLLRRAYEHARRIPAPGGLLGLGLFRPRQAATDLQGDVMPLTVTMPDGSRMQAAELAFSFGLHESRGANALAALRFGVWGATVFVLLYALPAFVETRDYDSFPYLSALARVISVAGYWLIGAFFLGYFYDLIRGGAGWEKGAWLALGISLANEPMTILAATSAADLAAVAISVAQRFAFFIFVGLVAFDRRLFQQAIGRTVDWKLFPSVSRISVVGAFTSVIIASAGVAISSAFTGQLTTVLGLVAAALLPSGSPIAAPAQ